MSEAAADRLLSEILDRLWRLEQLGAGNRARHARRVLQAACSGGRPAIDDSQMLAEVATLASTRGCAAVSIIATKYAADTKARAALARRLRRKRKNGQNSFSPRRKPIRG